VENTADFTTPLEITELERRELEDAMDRIGAPRFRGRQILQWLYRRGVTEFPLMTNLGRALQTQLASQLSIVSPTVVARQTSSDGTTKFLLRLADDRRIEAVYIPDTPAQTFCVSTQVGCAMACGFCLTGKMGLTRHLTAGEIAGQVRVLAHETGLASTPDNIVLMGMGEPLHNYDATMKALRILADDEGLAVHPRRVTLSTVGIVPALEKLATEPFMPNLAISLHATTDEQRSQLVPINRRYHLAELIEACRRLPLPRRRRITFEYVLLDGVNDTTDDARRLSQLLAGLQAKVNLLPLNEAAGIPFTRPSDDRVNAFARALVERGLTVSVRKSRGRDIRAACGQLLVEGERKSPGRQAAREMDL
jgi:23S rRNA (adenine2503-C2)-methyltransferase